LAREAHVESPTGGSILLAGALLKLGAYGMLCFSLPLFPFAAQYFQPFIATHSCVGNNPSLKLTVSSNSSCGQIASAGSTNGSAANRSSKHSLQSADMADKRQFTMLEVTSALSIGLRLNRIATKLSIESFDSANEFHAAH